MNRILEVNPEERWARVQPGVVLARLNAELAPHGLHFAPDPATADRCAIGGMIANNSSGTRSVRYGKTSDYVVETRVLLAEDNVVNQKVARRMLEKAGCTVMIAVNGMEVLERLAQHPFDMVFMDCQMPEMDGFEATAAIRNYEGERGRIPIIALTAHAVRGYEEKCRNVGMDDYLAKPLDQARLLEILSKYAPPRSTSDETK